MTPNHRSAWTDEPLDEKMTSIDRPVELFQQDVRAIREDMRSMRSEIQLLRSDFASLQDRLVQIGFGLAGTLLVAFCALVAAVA